MMAAKGGGKPLLKDLALKYNDPNATETESEPLNGQDDSKPKAAEIGK